jgi:hypothetical protein
MAKASVIYWNPEHEWEEEYDTLDCARSAAAAATRYGFALFDPPPYANEADVCDSEGNTIETYQDGRLVHLH